MSQPGLLPEQSGSDMGMCFKSWKLDQPFSICEGGQRVLIGADEYLIYAITHWITVVECLSQVRQTSTRADVKCVNEKIQ